MSDNRRRVRLMIAGSAVLVVGLSAVICSMIFNAPLVQWRVTRAYVAHQAVFEAVAKEMRDQRFASLALNSSGGVSAKCDQSVISCPPPSQATQEILAGLGFDRAYRTNQDVFFVKQSGFQYEMGVASLAFPPQKLVHQGPPFEEHVPLGGAWYFYRYAD